MPRIIAPRISSAHTQAVRDITINLQATVEAAGRHDEAEQQRLRTELATLRAQVVSSGLHLSAVWRDAAAQMLGGTKAPSTTHNTNQGKPLMWFKNLCIYKLPDDFELDAAKLEAALQEAAIKPCGATEQSCSGFVTPFPEGSGGSLVLASSAAALFTLEIQVRVLPPSVIRDALRERIADYRTRMARTPGKRVRDQLKDEVMLDLLPRALVRRKQVSAYLDGTNRLLLVDTTSPKVSELVAKRLRDVLVSFPAEQLACEESLSGLMTTWMLEGKGAGGFMLGDECLFKDPLDTRSKIRATQHDLQIDEVKEHARGGKRVSQLSLVFDNRIQLVLDEHIIIRKLRFLDIVRSEMGDISGEDAAAELDARFTLMVLELRRLYTALDALLRWV